MARHGEGLYQAESRVMGGRAQGHGRTAGGELEVDLRMPKELGGDGGATNPEQLFAVGYAACFESALTQVGQRNNLDTGNATIDSKVMLMPIGKGQFKLGVGLDVTLPSIEDPEQAAKNGARGRPCLSLLQRHAREYRRRIRREQCTIGGLTVRGSGVA